MEEEGRGLELGDGERDRQTDRLTETLQSFFRTGHRAGRVWHSLSLVTVIQGLVFSCLFNFPLCPFYRVTFVRF